MLLHGLHVPKRSNCWVWAHWHARQRRKRGLHPGYICSRPSHNLRWLRHRLWSRDLTHWFGYAPLRDPAARGWQRYRELLADCGGLWFRGHVVEEYPAHSPEHHSR